jgi:DNA repair REX1-B
MSLHINSATCSAFTDYKAKRLPIDQYQSICGIVTDGFQEVSQQIQTIERQLRDTYSREELAQLIRRVQESEREKLKMVRYDPFLLLAFYTKIATLYNSNHHHRL